VHVTWRLREGLPSLRSAAEFAVITRACEDVQAAREGFRVVHFTVMGDHVHALVEGASREELGSALASLTICWAKRLNRLWRRKGLVFPDRRHEHVLRSPTEVYHALRYVLSNARHHGVALRPGAFDPFSSASTFDRWRLSRSRPEVPRRPSPPPGFHYPVQPPGSWLLGVGWTRVSSVLYLDDVPGPR
jgi:REP element-mobilizing transposase RayT